MTEFTSSLSSHQFTGYCPDCGIHLDSQQACPSGCVARTLTSSPESIAANKEIVQVQMAPLPAGRRILSSILDYTPVFFLEIVGAALGPATLFTSSILTSLIGAIYFLLKDYDGGKYGFGRRQSKSRVIDLKTLDLPSLATCAKRNSYYIGAYLLSMIPVVEVLSVLLVFGFIIIDFFMIIFDKKGRRIGDYIAQTQVTNVQ